MSKITRKDFLKTAGSSIAGVAMVGAMGGLLTGCSTSSAGDAMTPPSWPYKYKKLDVDQVKERTYDAYKNQGGWGIGVAEGFFGTLADEVGYPYNQIPTGAFISFAGGYGHATLCGSLGVAATCIGMVAEKEMQNEIIGKLFSWYRGQNFPEYQPENMNLTQTVAESLLCDDSVGKYMKAEGVGYGDPERKARCAGVAAEVAGKTVELLNEYLG